jgi:hypothetical protein
VKNLFLVPALIEQPYELDQMGETKITHLGDALPSVGSVGCMCCA